jgi:protein-L-isoaspartate O-methyltransferase
MNERQLRDLTFDFRAARAVMAAVAVGAIERLAAEPCAADELARACGLHPRGAAVLLAALAALGVCDEEDGRFALTAAARRVLVGTGDRSRRSIVLHDLWHWGLWGRLEASLRSGAPLAERAGDVFFSDPAVLGAFFPNFARAMEETSRDAAARLARELPLAGSERVLDLGGGAGGCAAALARAHPKLEVVVFELPPMAREAERALEAAGLAERVAVRAGSFLADPLDPEGAGFDLALLSRVLMGMSDRDAAALLARTRAALRPGGRVVVHEFRRGDGAAERVGALLDLDMLLLTGGAVRRPEALASLLEGAGFLAALCRPFGALGVLATGTA